MTTYRCYFEWNGKSRWVESDNGPSAFTGGFWINEDSALTTGMDAKYWIPPHRIKYVEADRGDE